MASITQTPTQTTRKAKLRELIYLDLAILGTGVPLFLIGKYVAANGLALGPFLQQAFANSAASILTIDLLMSSAIFWVLAAREMDRLGTGKGKLPVFMVLNLCIGLSSALPAFMWWRERKLNAN